MTDTGDGTADTRAMTYDDLAKARGISRDSAIRLVQRRGWRRVTGNDGRALVYIPTDALTIRGDDGGSDTPQPQPDGGDITPDVVAVSAVFGRALDALIEALSAERARVAAIEAQADGLARQVRQAAGERDAARQQALDAGAERDAAQAEAEAARSHAEAVQAERDKATGEALAAGQRAAAAEARAARLERDTAVARALPLPKRLWRAIRGR